jgi:hypothetical protein
MSDSKDAGQQPGQDEKQADEKGDDSSILLLANALNNMRIRSDSTNIIITSSDGRQVSAHSIVLESTSVLFAELIEVGIFINGLFL